MNRGDHASKLRVWNCREVLRLHTAREPAFKNVTSRMVVRYPMVTAHFMTAPVRKRNFFAVVGFSVRSGEGS